ncbi:MAG: hypothetical protein OXH47_07555, partial [Paracoccaceae bacterium]|nr:hypothetical protein [Paracoccaceae bacterium]
MAFSAFFKPGQEVGTTDDRSAVRSSTEGENSDTEKPFMSREVMSAEGPITSFILPPRLDFIKVDVSMLISSSVHPPRLLINATNDPDPAWGSSLSIKRFIASFAVE